jgi:hypothetical protein
LSGSPSLMDPWKAFIDLAQGATDLSSTEKQYLNETSKDNLLDEVKRLDEIHASTSKIRAISRRLSPFIDCLFRYASALDVISNVQPMPLAPLWGGVRIVLLVSFQILELTHHRGGVSSLAFVVTDLTLY